MWNPDAGAFTQSGYNVALAYPGNAYVDVIGLDAYDQTWASPQTPTNAWNQTTLPTLVAAQRSPPPVASPWPSPSGAWPSAPTATAWAMTRSSSTNMVAWMKNPANDVAYETYFDVNSGGVNSDLTGGSFPNALAAFTADLG